MKEEIKTMEKRIKSLNKFKKTILDLLGYSYICGIWMTMACLFRLKLDLIVGILLVYLIFERLLKTRSLETVSDIVGNVDTSEEINTGYDVTNMFLVIFVGYIIYEIPNIIGNVIDPKIISILVQIYTIIPVLTVHLTARIIRRWTVNGKYRVSAFNGYITYLYLFSAYASYDNYSNTQQLVTLAGLILGLSAIINVFLIKSKMLINLIWELLICMVASHFIFKYSGISIWLVLGVSIMAYITSQFAVKYVIRWWVKESNKLRDILNKLKKGEDNV